MAVAFASVASPGYTALSWTHVVPDGGGLIVFDGNWNNQVPSACTYGNKPMTRRGYINNLDAITVFTIEDVSGRDDDVVRMTGGGGTTYPTSIAVSADGTLVFGDYGKLDYTTNIDWQNREIPLDEFDGQLVVSCAGTTTGDYVNQLSPLPGHSTRREWGGGGEGFGVYTGEGNIGGFYHSGGSHHGVLAVTLYDIAAGGRLSQSVVVVA